MMARSPPSRTKDGPVISPAMEPIPGAVPSLLNVAPGCRYAGRCPWVEDRCRREKLGVTGIAPGHFVACFAVEDGRAAPV
jgi:peptide/nickel transport system ATP-binding protein